MTGSASLVVVNNFLHDLATGTWFGVSIVMWRLAGLAQSPGLTGLGGAVRLVQRELFWWGLFALTIVIGSGVIRTFTYGRSPVPEQLRVAKLRLLIVKHVLLGAVFGIGTVLQYTLAFRG